MRSKRLRIGIALAASGVAALALSAALASGSGQKPALKLEGGQAQFTGSVTGGAGKPQISGHFWVPMEDENHMVWNWTYRWDGEPLPQSEWKARQPTYQGGEQLPGFRKVNNRDNNWRIDREAQKSETFSGIDGVNTQDHAVQESMGSIVDRSREHLGTTDKAVVTSRLLLMKAVATSS